MANEPGVFRQTVDAVLSPILGFLNFATSDKALNAFFRQGVNELAAGFGEFWPQSITAIEPASMFHPLHSDLAETGRQEDGPGLPTPAQLARDPTGGDRPRAPNSNGVGPVRADPLPTLSEIARDTTPPKPEPAREQGHERS